MLQGAPIATLQDASAGTLPVVLVYSSYDVTLQGFTISGGLVGVWCDASICWINQNTVQQASLGIDVMQSQGRVNGNHILGNAEGLVVGRGSAVSTSSNVISGNQYFGIDVGPGSLVATSDVIKDNYIGIRTADGSVLEANDLQITGNNHDGVYLGSNATARFQQFDTGNIITGNGGDGVSIHDLSFALFAGQNQITGNGSGTDVACYPQYSATRGADTVGGTTNCKEPSMKQVSQ